MNEDRQEKDSPTLPSPPDVTSSSTDPPEMYLAPPAAAELALSIPIPPPSSDAAPSPAPTSGVSDPVDRLLHRIRDIEEASRTVTF
jgi:hypothetical protein